MEADPFSGGPSSLLPSMLKVVKVQLGSNV